jgi:hypothetical protein
MKRTRVASPKGVAILQRQDQLTQDELQNLAAQLGEKNFMVAFLKGIDASKISVTAADADAPAATEEEDWFLTGRDLADQYGLHYQGLSRANNENHIVFDITFEKIAVAVDTPDEVRRELTAKLRSMKRI